MIELFSFTVHAYCMIKNGPISILDYRNYQPRLDQFSLALRPIYMQKLVQSPGRLSSYELSILRKER
jgi:hypothetical protein